MNNLKETQQHNAELYALFKQATVGDCKIDLSEIVFEGDALEAWNAWKHKQGTDPEKAKLDYVNNVRGLVSSIGLRK